MTTYTCEIGIASKIENGETGIASKKVENSILDSEITQNMNKQTDSLRSAGNSKTVLEHSGISRERTPMKVTVLTGLVETKKSSKSNGIRMSRKI